MDLLAALALAIFSIILLLAFILGFALICVSCRIASALEFNLLGADEGSFGEVVVEFHLVLSLVGCLLLSMPEFYYRFT